MIEIFIVIIGKTASGKTNIANKLSQQHGFKQIVTYTTRLMRDGEKQDATYHFISTEDFKQKIEEEFFAEWKTYETQDGIWYYGTALEDIENKENKENNTIIILTPNGYRDIIRDTSVKPMSIYLYANNTTIKKRLKKRGDDSREAQRRLEHDNKDFKGIENEVDKIIYNNDGTDIDDVVNKILELVEERNGK